MATKDLPSPEAIRQLLRYDPETGKLYWLARTALTCKAPEWFNSRFAGQEAITAPKSSGHLSGPLCGRTVLAHRVAWAVHYGEWPQGWLDHINGIRNDNRIRNLRIVGRAENAKNRRPNAGKRSGLPHGVSVKKNGRFFAQIQKDGVNHHLGYFGTAADAHDAYSAARVTLGFHENHGKAIPPAPPVQP